MTMYVILSELGESKDLLGASLCALVSGSE